MKQRIQWLDILRALNLLMVVMFHVQLIDLATGENHEFCRLISDPCSPIRMPLFFFLSGGLLYLSRIAKDWKTTALYLDKTIRIVIPWAVFVTFYYFFKLAFNPFTKTKVISSVGFFLESFFIYPDHPSAHLWFLPTLFWCMMLYPLYKWLNVRKGALLVLLVFTAAWYFVPMSLLPVPDVFCLLRLNQYLVFFVSGIVFFRFRLYACFSILPTFFLTLALYIVCYLYNVPLLTSFIGILCTLTLAQLLTHICPTLFSSFREYYYQIFLLSFIFQPFVELILWKKLFYDERLFYLFYIINILSGIYLPVLIAKCIECIPCKWLRLCFGMNNIKR